MNAPRSLRRSLLFLFLATATLPTLALAGPKRDGEQPPPVTTVIQRLNDQLAARGLNIRIAKAAFLAAPFAKEAGQTIFANDRTKRLDTHWVPGDPRRGGRNTITYLVDMPDGAANGGLSSAQTETAIDAAMNTWANVDCGNGKLPIVKVPATVADPDIIDGLFGFGGVGTPFTADIVHAGWMPGAFFDAATLGGSANTLAVTFTFVFTDPPSNNDINRDGKLDTAMTETYYNNAFSWAINGAMPPADVETVALHESGHSLSLDHFGKISETDSNGRLHFSPYSIMNALLSQLQHTPQGTDNAAHCGLWGNWPR